LTHENGEWIIRGMAWDNPKRLRTWREVIDRIKEVGFLPFFSGEITGFSVEEQVSDLFWWTGDPEQDPWEWRALIAQTGEVAYGKFFGKKAGFISKEWFPSFANYRRDGYDFDSRWDEELASLRNKKIMDQFIEKELIQANELKQLAGFGKGGEKNFDGVVSDLQMQTYLVIRDFRRRRNKMGFEYGMPVTVYSTPESLWGYDHIASAYHFSPDESRDMIAEQMKKFVPNTDDSIIKAFLR